MLILESPVIPVDIEIAVIYLSTSDRWTVLNISNSASPMDAPLHPVMPVDYSNPWVEADYAPKVINMARRV